MWETGILPRVREVVGLRHDTGVALRANNNGIPALQSRIDGEIVRSSTEVLILVQIR